MSCATTASPRIKGPKWQVGSHFPETLLNLCPERWFFSGDLSSEGDCKKCLRYAHWFFQIFYLKNLPKAPLLPLAVALLTLNINPNRLQQGATTLCHRLLRKRQSLTLPCAQTFHLWMRQFHCPKKDQIVNLGVEQIDNHHTSTVNETTIANPHWWTNGRSPQGFIH